MYKTAHSKEDPTLAAASMAFQDHWSKMLCLGDHAKRGNLCNSVAKELKVSRKQTRKLESCGRKAKGPEKQEIVLETRNLHLSLAEKMGLVDSPGCKNVTEPQWAKAKELSNGRFDSLEPCPICKEYFVPARQQVLLSCSHVFHLNCIRSYEKFSGRKSCPICRAKDYQTRLIYDGEKMVSHRMAIKIQSVWKMHAVRKWYLQMRDRIPPKEPSLRRKFYERRLERLSQCTANVRLDMDNRVQSLFQEIDDNIKATRRILNQCNTPGPTDCQWIKIEDQAISREMSDCLICLMPLQGPVPQIVLLSCSHVLHLNCLESYESFLKFTIPVCPLCRCHYVKRIL